MFIYYQKKELGTNEITYKFAILDLITLQRKDIDLPTDHEKYTTFTIDEVNKQIFLGQPNGLI